MPSDFDNILKDKLSGYEAPFNAGDWQQMEGMLKEDSGTPFLFIAFLMLMMGVGGLWMGSGEIEESIGAYSSKHFIGTDADQGNSDSELNVAESSKVESSTFEVHLNDSPEIGVVVDNEENINNAGEEISTEQVSSAKKVAHTGSEEIISKSSSGNSIGAISTKTELNKNTSPSIATAPVEDDFSASTLRNLQSQLIAEKNIDALGSLSLNDSNSKQKRNRPIVKFAMGAGTGIIFSFLDINDLTRPGYNLYLAEELMFINRIGLTFTQGYYTINYSGGRFPYYGNGYDSPVSYTSQVRSINFGVDVKANLVHKTRWNWYVKAGIQNVIKLQESFAYQYPHFDTIPNPPQTTLPTQNSFTSPEASFDMTGGLTGNVSDPVDLTISGAKRYHPEFRFASGFDVLLNSRMKLQFELAHSFTRPTVGNENQWLQNFGLSGAFLYSFGQ